ncbi:DUF6113 family protein [Actinocorallia populi]|uniref:DUF6113 family protein n=1 Tax=Actinocorallia populi TaxID=2079200 RepID=UPI000D08CD07|nr:DUF6113 family protein [Actinocorallia populi]
MNRSDSVLRGALYGLLALGGALLALVGSFSFGYSLMIAAALCVLNLAAFRAAGWAAGGRTGALVPAAAWLTTAGVLSMPRSEGDVIITSGAGGMLFLFGGSAAALLAAALTPATRSWLTGLPHDAPARSR